MNSFSLLLPVQLIFLQLSLSKAKGTDCIWDEIILFFVLFSQWWWRIDTNGWWSLVCRFQIERKILPVMLSAFSKIFGPIFYRQVRQDIRIPNAGRTIQLHNDLESDNIDMIAAIDCDTNELILGVVAINFAAWKTEYLSLLSGW